ncbi:hypothetical protein [Fluviispira multicolorata]|uniref:DNA polymerase-3 subunit delta n=1 Tax=Fluviispira multicolorata TaxID=2654512 RepID=A0A833N4X3_9BACT|nr:hypothetical protein [Fluviispira multicolorata]KAB8033292.1 hypothetical protein GCL57_00930 [Fluviispira multicolorata]
MKTFNEFILNIKNNKHHALLFVSRQFENNDFPEEHFRTLVKETCEIELFKSENTSAFEIASSHPDIFIADRQRKILRIEDLSKIKDLSLYQPNEGTHRFFFIENCERMNANSANALLKSLEEPPAKSLFILTTKDINLVLPTISSRCQRVFLRFEDIEKKNIISEISVEDYNSIKLQINQFKNSIPNINNFLSEKIIKKINPFKLKSIIELSEKLSKEYKANTLQDIIVFITNERLKKEPEFLSVSKFILSQISQWKNNESMNPSTQLWLIRIFSSFQVN